MGNYYFLSIYLPDLKINEKPELNLDELKSLLKQHLSDKDFALCIKFLQGERVSNELAEKYLSFLEESKRAFVKIRTNVSTENKEITELYQNNIDPKSLYSAFNKYKLNKIEELCGLNKFTIDIIIAYLAKFLIISEIFSLNDRAGLKILARLEEEEI